MTRFLLTVPLLLLSACGARASAPTSWDRLGAAPVDREIPALGEAWLLDPVASAERLTAALPEARGLERRAVAAALLRVAVEADGAALPPPAAPDPAGDAWERWLLEEAAQVAGRTAALAADPLLPPPQHPFAPERWRVLGPVSSLDGVPLSPTDPLLTDDVLPERFDLPGAALVARRVHDDGRGARLARGAGVWVAESFVSLPAASDVIVVGGAAGRWRLWLDDRVVLERPLVERYAAETRVATVSLAAGTYRLRMEIGADTSGDATVRIVPRDPDVVPAWSDAPDGAPGRVGSVRPEPLWSAEGPEIGWMAAAELAALAGDAEAALALVEALPEGVSAALVGRRLAGAAAQLPANLRDDLAVDALNAAAQDPAVGRLARAALVVHLVERGLIDEAERAVTPLREDQQRGGAGDLAIASYLGARDLPELELRHLEAAALAGRDSCDLRGQLLRSWERLGLVQDPALLPAAWFACDNVLEWSVRAHWLPRGELETARRYAATMLVRSPDERSIAWLVADIAAAQGDEAGVLAALRHEAAWGAEPDLPPWELVDRTAASGDLGSASALLAERRARQPYELGLVRADAWLLGERALVADRIDGSAIVDAYLAEEPAYGGDVVYVLDYSKARFFEDGSWYEVVHQIFQPRTRDAIGAFGEQGIPGDATLLQARTIKRDGRAFVAPDIAGKDSISMPFLEIGDFIEIEWVRSAGPGAPERLGVLGSRFYFQVADGVLHHTEAVYEYPAAWEDRVAIDLRNFDGDATIDVLEDGYVRRGYVMRATLPPRPEPRSAAGDEWLPSVRFTVGADDDAVVERYGNLVATRTVPDALVVEEAQALALGARSNCEAARRIFRFVNDEVIELSGFFSDPPPWVLHAGEGERLSLTWSMLEAAGLDPDLFFVLPMDGDSTEGVPLDPNVYEVTAIRVRDGRRACWMEPEWENQPFDFLRPEAQGRPALAVAGPAAGSRIETPRWPAEAMRGRIELQVRVDADGTGHVIGRELLPVQSWAGIRSFAEQVPDMDEIAREFEASLSRSFPAVTMQSVQFEHVEDPDAQIGIVYRFTSDGLAQRDATGRWRIDTTIYERPLGASYGSLAARQTDMVIALPHDEDLFVSFDLPDGAERVVAPESRLHEYGGNRLERAWRIDGTHVVLERRARIPAQRVAPADYPDFARFARDAESTGRVLVEWETR